MRTVIGMPTVRVLEHVPFAALAAAEADLRSGGVDLDVRHLQAGDPVGDTSFDALVVLGGPQSAYSPEGYPTRSAELTLIRHCLDTSTPFLGVCLGAQLLAVAAGGTVYPMEMPDLGWRALTLHPAARTDLLVSSWPEEVTVMQSHADHLTLPPGATLLASSTASPNELFRVGPAAWGTQFHPEAGPDFAATRLALLAAGALPLWEHLEDADEVVEASVARAERFAPHRRELFTRFAALASAQVPSQRLPAVPAKP